MKYTAFGSALREGDIFTMNTVQPWWKFWMRKRKYRITKIVDSVSYHAEEIIPVWQFWRKR